MLSKEVLGLLSVGCVAIGYGRYFWDIMKSKTKPHAFSWIIWGLLSVIAFFAQRSDAAGAGSWAAGASAVVCLMVTFFALARGEKNIRKSDWFAFAGALAAIPLWVLTGSALGAVILVSTINALGFYPTVRKSYRKPHEETAFLYVMEGLKHFFALCALEHYSMITVFYPLFVGLMNLSFAVMLFWRRRLVAMVIKT